MPRPKLDNPKTERLGLRVLPEQKAEIEAYAKQRGLSKSQVLLEDFQLLLKKEETGK